MERQTEKQTAEAMLEKINREIVQGLKHGFFAYSIEGTLITKGKCEVTFKAGKSYKFHIALEELREPCN